MSLQELRGLPLLPGLASIFRLVRFDGDPRINPRHKPFLAAATVVTPSEICMNPPCILIALFVSPTRSRREIASALGSHDLRMKAAKLLLFRPSIRSQKAGSSSEGAEAAVS